MNRPQDHDAHAIVSGVTVWRHGYRRSTVDLDLLVRDEDAVAICSALEQGGFPGQVAIESLSGPLVFRCNS